MFLNCSNHASENWTEAQLAAARAYGIEVIRDYTFPSVPADVDEQEIEQIAQKVCEEIMDMHPMVVMCQGEFTLTYALIKKLLAHGVKVVAACSERDTVEVCLPDGSVKKESNYKFVRFREYK